MASAESERAKRVSRALANPIYFGEMYVRPYDSNWTAPLPTFAQEMMQFTFSTQRGVVILPPEFLKTTLISQVFPLWLTFRARCFGELLRGMLLSEEEGMAINNLSVISWHILHNEDLRRDFSDSEGRPLVYPDPTENVWREDSIIVARDGASKDPTWQAKGLDSKGIQGRRLDWLIGDDVITPANAFSPAKREKAMRDWDMQITTRLVDDGRAIICGNFNDPLDLVSTLAARPSYKVFKRPAVHLPGKQDQAVDLTHPEATALWPENWPLSRLRKEKEEKPSRFQRIFLLSATSELGEKLRTDWVRLIKPEDTPLRYCKFFMAFDPAPGGEAHDLDYFNVSVGAMHEHGLDVVESIDVRCPTPRQVQLVGIMHDRFDRLGMGVVAIGCARLALDRYFRGALIVARPDLEGKLVDISVPGMKEERLEALGPYAQTGWMRIQEELWDRRTSDAEDQWQELTMREQWKEFPLGRHDDKLDGLDILIRTAREFSLIASVEYELEATVAYD
jgi:hypothetical protein